MSEPRKHHYLPKFYLRNFASAAGHLTQVDRQTGRSFGASVNDAAAIRDFHRLDYDDADEFAFEKALSTIEGELATILAGIVAVPRVPLDAMGPLLFLVAQLRMRVPAMHAHVERMAKGIVRSSLVMLERNKGLPSIPVDLAGASISDMVDIHIANWMCLKLMFEAASDESHIDWLAGFGATLLVCPPGVSFLTSDQPVALYEPVRPQVATAGFSPALEITVPLSKSLAFRLMGPADATSAPPTEIASVPQVEEINRRTIIMASRWVFAAPEFDTAPGIVERYSGQFAGLKEDVLDDGVGFLHINRIVPVGPPGSY